MADREAVLPGNVPGKFYVDATCGDCNNCRKYAPKNFERNDKRQYAFVSKQPENNEERRNCLEAMKHCLSAAIGDDGDT